MLKHSGSATRLGAESPDERGGRERTLESGSTGVRPRSRSFCCEKLYFGARPGGFALGPDPELFGDGEDEGGEGHEHGGHGEEDARGGAEEGVAGLGLLGLYVDHIVLL